MSSAALTVAGRATLSTALVAAAVAVVGLAVTGAAQPVGTGATSPPGPSTAQLVGVQVRGPSLLLVVAPAGGGQATDLSVQPGARLTLDGAATTASALGRAVRAGALPTVRVWLNGAGRVVRADAR